MKRLTLTLATLLMLGTPALANSGTMDFPHLTWPNSGGTCSGTVPCEPSK